MAKAEVKYKKQVNKALNELIIPPLQNIVNKFVQLTSLSGQRAWYWDYHYDQGVVIIKKSEERSGFDPHQSRNVCWSEPVGESGWTTWTGPEIGVTLDINRVNQAARQFHNNTRVVFTFSDSHNWSLDETSPAQ